MSHRGLCASMNQKSFYSRSAKAKRDYLQKNSRGRLKLILRGKRFGFSLEDIRQLLEMYDMGDQQQTQLLRTYELATDKLTDLKNQRDEIEETIKELQQQIQWGKELISSMGLVERT